tara:strand:- start:1613 stop:2731 length:1119 start_codon:yes stop_codon:yes gene_type:complete
MPFIGGGGVEKNLFIIANHLSKKFDKIRICTLSRDKIGKFNKKIQYLGPSKNFYEKLNIRLKYMISLMILFKFLIKNRNSTVLSFQANIYCIVLCKFLNIKIIIRSNSSPSGWYHNTLKKIIYKYLISKADCVIVNSLEFKTQMERKFNIKVNCIFNPLDLKNIKRQSYLGKPDPFFNRKKCLKLINLGRFTDQKNQITILKACKILKDLVDFRLLIFGRGIEKDKMQKFIFDNNLQEYVKLRNFIENPYRIIRQSDIFVLSSKYEGLPNVLLEAASLKKIILSTKCPTGPKEILLNGKGGVFFKIGDHKELARKIRYINDNKEKMREKINICFKNLNKYDYKKNLNKYQKLINDIMQTNLNSKSFSKKYNV